jgi:hypothetical protein
VNFVIPDPVMMIIKAETFDIDDSNHEHQNQSVAASGPKKEAPNW